MSSTLSRRAYAGLLGLSVSLVQLCLISALSELIWEFISFPRAVWRAREDRWVWVTTEMHLVVKSSPALPSFGLLFVLVRRARSYGWLLHPTGRVQGR